MSDTCYHDSAKDTSGPEAQKCVTDEETSTGAILKGQILCKKIVLDNEHDIMVNDLVRNYFSFWKLVTHIFGFVLLQKILIEWSDGLNVNVILTTGGTGFAERDVTPEATKRVIDKEAPGLSMAILNYGLKKTPMAILSR